MMKLMLSLFLLKLIQSEQLIKNLNSKACRNCIYFKPNNNNFNDPFFALDRCSKFGERNIITGEIKYEYAYNCRNNEAECGKEGKCFEEDKNLDMKIFRYSVIKNIPTCLAILFTFFIFFIEKK